MSVAFDEPDHAIVRLAEACSAFRNRIEHRLNIRRRAGDDTQDFARRRLLLQRFFEFVKQPHFLWRSPPDPRSFEEFDLRRGEGTYFHATRGQFANEFPLLTKGNGQKRAEIAGGTHCWEIILPPARRECGACRARASSEIWFINTDLEPSTRLWTK